MSEQKSASISEKPPGNIGKKLLISIVIGLGIFIALSFYAEIGDVAHAFAEFKWVYIPAILALTFINYLLRFYKWDFYLRKISIKLAWRDSMSIFLSGLTMSVTPAKLGEVFKSYLLKRLNGTEVSRSIPIVFAERVTDVLGMLILAAVSFSAFRYGRVVLVVILIATLIPIAVLQWRWLCLKLLGITSRIPWLSRLSESFITTYKSAYVLFRLGNLLIAVLLSVVSWGFECLAMYFVLKGFNVDASVALSTFVFAFSSLAGAVTMVPGGLGVAEGSSTALLILDGISKGIAVSATMIIRFCTLWFGVAVGIITFFLRRKSLNL
jgi:uncharacterized protein (TIRG00374 family)